MLVTFLMISQCCFSQTGYPRKILINKDTLVVLTTPQLKKVNMTFVRLDFFREMNDTLNSIISSYKTALSTQSDLNSSLQKQIDLKQTIIIQEEAVISNYKITEKKLERQMKWLKVQRNTFFVTTVILAAKVFLFK